MAIADDWYPNALPNQRLMFVNVNAKIDDYKIRYELSDDELAEVHLLCETFVAAFDWVEQNRATGKQMNKWFENLLTGDPVGASAPHAPVFQTLNLTPGAVIGIEKKFRAFVRRFKENAAYRDGDGLNLMIVASEAANEDIRDAFPELTVTVSADNLVSVGWKKGSFTALELQYRQTGEQLWQMADKSTERTISFAPPLTGGAPQRFEFRAIYLLKNERVGQWSQTYQVTVG